MLCSTPALLFGKRGKIIARLKGNITAKSFHFHFLWQMSVPDMSQKSDATGECPFSTSHPLYGIGALS